MSGTHMDSLNKCPIHQVLTVSHMKALVTFLLLIVCIDPLIGQELGGDVVFDSDIDQNMAWKKARDQYRQNNYSKVISIYDSIYRASLGKMQRVMVYKVMNESYLRLISQGQLPKSSKAEEVYQEALQWYGQKFMKEKWTTVTEVWDEWLNQFDSPPEFPGGLKAYSVYLTSSIQYPTNGKTMGIEGKVVVEFMVNPDGTKDAFHIYKGLGEEFDKEAIRVIREAPNFIPAFKSNQAVYANMLLPVVFKLPK